MDHGHHPKHAFEPAVEDTSLDVVAQALLATTIVVAINAALAGAFVLQAGT